MTMPMKKAISRLKIKQLKNVSKKTHASSRVARKVKRISFQSINVWTVAIKSAAKAVRGIWRTQGQRKKIEPAVIKLEKRAASLLFAPRRKLTVVRVALPEAGIEPCTNARKRFPTERPKT